MRSRSHHHQPSPLPSSSPLAPTSSRTSASSSALLQFSQLAALAVLMKSSAFAFVYAAFVSCAPDTLTHSYIHECIHISCLWRQLKRGVWRQLRTNETQKTLNAQPTDKTCPSNRWPTVPLYVCLSACLSHCPCICRHTRPPASAIARVQQTLELACATQSIKVSQSQSCDRDLQLDLELNHNLVWRNLRSICARRLDTAPVWPAANANFLIVINNSPLGIVKQLKQTRHSQTLTADSWEERYKQEGDKERQRNTVFGTSLATVAAIG